MASAAVVLAAAAMYATWRIVEPKAGLDWFYDEMWRVDLLRRSDWREAYVRDATPLPALWFVALRAMIGWGYYAPETVRGLAGLLAAAAPLSVGLLAARVLAREGRGLSVGVAAAGAAASLMVMAGRFVAEVGSYVNGYLFEAGVSIGVVALCASIPRNRPAPLGMRVALVLCCASTIGGVLLLPGVAITLVIRAMRMEGDERRRELVRHALTFAGAGIVGLIAYITAYGSGARRGSTQDFFADQQFSGGVLDVPGQVWTFVVDALDMNGIPQSAPVLVAALTVIGLGVTVRRQPVVVASLALALLGAVVISPFTGWPATVFRVNAPIVLLMTTIPAIGAAYLVSSLVTFLSRQLANAVAAVALVVLAVSSWTPQTADPPWEFARGLTHDIEPIAATEFDRNVVITYHRMARWYIHDRLVTGYDGPAGRYRFIDEEAQDRSLYERLPAVLAERGVDDGDAIWCVLPYDMGPDDYERACRVDGGRERITVHRGIRAEVVLYPPA